MPKKCASQVSAFVFAMIVPMLLCPGTSAQAKKNCDLKDLSTISAALDICNEVDVLTKPSNTPNLLNSVALDKKAIAKAIETARKKHKIASTQIDELTEEEQKYWRDRKRATTMVKVSVALIGGVGAGVGGYLRLKSSKDLERDGTKVSLFAGLAGGALGLVAIRLDSCQKFRHAVSYINSYMILKEPDTNSDTYCKEPSRLSKSVPEMKGDLAKLNDKLNELQALFGLH
jgi:hypothetical protein